MFLASKLSTVEDWNVYSFLFIATCITVSFTYKQLYSNNHKKSLGQNHDTPRGRLSFEINKNKIKKNLNLKEQNYKMLQYIYEIRKLIQSA